MPQNCELSIFPVKNDKGRGDRDNVLWPTNAQPTNEDRRQENGLRFKSPFRQGTENFATLWLEHPERQYQSENIFYNFSFTPFFKQTDILNETRH